jgi:L-amino acid N-acyltransferase YncA
VIVRVATAADAPAVAELYRPIVAETAISFETEPPDADEMRRRILDTLPVYPWLVCELGGRVAGYAYATRHRTRAAYQWSVDTSVYVAAGDRRAGVGRALYTSLFAILSAQGYFNVFAGIALPNPASVALHEAMGFQPIGVYLNVGYKLGAWRDVGWWQLALRDAEAPPQPPLSMEALRTHPDWNVLLAPTRMPSMRAFQG